MRISRGHILPRTKGSWEAEVEWSEGSPEANNLFPKFAPMLEFLRRYEFHHVQVVGSRLKVLTQCEDIDTHILHGCAHMGDWIKQCPMTPPRFSPVQAPQCVRTSLELSQE